MLTVLFVQVDSIDLLDLKLKLDQLQISVNKKDQEIDGYKRTVTNLNNTVTRLQTTVSKLQALVKDMSEKNSNEEFETFKWVVAIDKLKQNKQYSKRFYFISAPFSFQLSAVIKQDRLETWFYRCRGKNDTMGKILSNFCNYRCVMYLVNESGDVHCNSIDFSIADTSCFNIGASYERSKGAGWLSFCATSHWTKFLINDHLHLCFKVLPRFI